jgi:hypothetical protein
MNSLVIGGTSLACAFGGVLVGMLLARAIPITHLDTNSREGIKLGTGLVATMAALVLGLLISGAKSSFDSQSAGLRQLAGNLMFLDRTLAHYGADADRARAHLHDMVAAMVDRIWATDGSPDPASLDAVIADHGRATFDAIRELTPDNEVQQDSRARALQMNGDLTRARWLITHRDYDTFPMAFLVVLLFWFFILFASLGAFWARNLTVVLTIFVCSVSVASAMFLIADMDQPFEGLIQVSPGTLNDALTQMEK